MDTDYDGGGAGGGGGGGGASGSSSLALKLMSVAGEYELQRKRERDRYEARLTALSESKAALEAQQRSHRSELETLTRQLASLSSSLETLRQDNGSRISSLEASLADSRLGMHQRATQLLQLLQLHVKAGGAGIAAGAPLGSSLDENVNPNDAHARALQKHVTSLAEQLSSLEADVASTAEYSSASILRAAESGNEEELTRLLSPVSHALATDTAPDAPLTVAPLPPRLAATLECALHKAVARGHARVVARLMRQGVSPVARSDDGLHSSLLHVAAEHGMDALLKTLLSRMTGGKDGLGVDDRDAYDRTALHRAASGDHASAARVLLLAGADAAARDVAGLSPRDLTQGTEVFLASTGEVVDLGTDPASASRLFRAGELRVNPAAPNVARLFHTTDVMFWNASVRANRMYNDKNFDRAIEAYGAAIDLATGGRMGAAARDAATLHYNRARARFRLGRHVAAIEDCDAALNRDAACRNALAQRAECYMALFDFDRAVRDFQSLLDSDPSDRQWARRLVEARGMRDMGHYGILGLRKDADAGSIKRAYRGLCLRWHPDKHVSSPEAVARANAAFRRISDAYEVLSDGYKRMVYDMDPRSNAGAVTSAEPPAGNSSGRSARSSSAGSAGAVASDADGFDKWYARELERDAERDREMQGYEARAAAVDAHALDARKAARELRRRLLAASRAVNDAAPVFVEATRAPADVPMGSVAATVSSARAALLAAAAPAPAPPGIATVPSIRRIASAGNASVESSDSGGKRPSTSDTLPPLRAASREANVNTSGAAQPQPKPTPVVTVTAAPPPPLDATKARNEPSDPGSPPPPPPGVLPRVPSIHVNASTGSSPARSRASTAASSPRDEDVSNAVAATAARARAAVAQAEAFVKLVHEHAAAVDRVQRVSSRAGSRPASGTSSPAAASPSPVRAAHDDAEDGFDEDAAAIRARFEARLRAQVDAMNAPPQPPPGTRASHSSPRHVATRPRDDDVDVSGDSDDVPSYPGLHAATARMDSRARVDDSVVLSDDEDEEDEGDVEDGARGSDGSFDPIAYAAYLRELGNLAADAGDDDEEFLAAIRRASGDARTVGGAAAHAASKAGVATGGSSTIGRRKPIPSLDALEAELAGLAQEALQHGARGTA